ncbi:MAG: nitroreductase family deazaflavin-dependent oxidoreductase [Microthrixaceae bacterium]
MAADASYNSRQVKVGRVVIRLLSRAQSWVYRRSGGRLGAKFLKGAPVLLVTTTGRRSGQPRTVPLLYLEDGDDIIVVASQGGMPTNPDWYYNVLADPTVTVTRGTDELQMVAREVEGDERAELWPRLVEMYADYEAYAERTERTIPVIRLSPAADDVS